MVRARLVMIGFIATLAALLAAAPATSLPNVPMPRTTSVSLKVDIVGYITVTHDFDSTDPCSWGSAYTVEEDFSFETGKAITTRFTQTKVPGEGVILGGANTKPTGSAISAARLDGWRTTNYCYQPQPEPVKPECRTARGKLTFTFGLAGDPGNEDDDLTPLHARSLLVYLTRNGGGNQNAECLSNRPTIDDVGSDYVDTYVDTNPLDRVNGAILPTGIDSIRALNLKKGGSTTRTVSLTGPCESVQVSNKSGGTVQSASLQGKPTQCWVKGKVVITLKRPKKG